MRKSDVDIVSPAKADSDFIIDVIKGLFSSPKFLKSKYFYDKRGDELFRKIMELPEYYLTRCELEILNNHKATILSLLDPGEALKIVDLGAGDGFKTKILLNHFNKKGLNFTYVPVDISQNAINSILIDFRSNLPEINVAGICKEYFSALKELEKSCKKVLLFLGSNIGNFSNEETRIFLKEIANAMASEDILLIGFDLRKDPDVILAAYNDKAGVTKEFNLNLLHRINREMKANFNPDLFEHSPYYDSESGEARSFLISKISQSVEIPALEMVVPFKEGEAIHTEISKKYSLKEIDLLAGECGFQVVRNFFDSANYFTNSIWKIK